MAVKEKQDLGILGLLFAMAHSEAAMGQPNTGVPPTSHATWAAVRHRCRPRGCYTEVYCYSHVSYDSLGCLHLVLQDITKYVPFFLIVSWDTKICRK